MGDGFKPLLHRYGSHPGRTRPRGDPIGSVPVYSPPRLPGFVVIYLFHTLDAWVLVGITSRPADLRGCLLAHTPGRPVLAGAAAWIP